LNTGRRGNAYGFKLESILKLIDTKANMENRKYTLLHYLVDLVQKKFPELLNLHEELLNIEEGSKSKFLYQNKKRINNKKILKN